MAEARSSIQPGNTVTTLQLLVAFDRVKALEAIKYAIDPTTM
jgi:hypothetical protein